MTNIAIVFLIWCFASPLTGMGGNDLLARVDRNLNPESYESYRKLINIEPNGREKEFVLFTVHEQSTRFEIESIFIDLRFPGGQCQQRYSADVEQYAPGRYAGNATCNEPVRKSRSLSQVGRMGL